MDGLLWVVFLPSHALSSLELSKHALNLSFCMRENSENRVCMLSKISGSGMEDGCREKFVCEVLASQQGTGGAKPGTDYDQLGGEGDPLKNEANQLTSVSQLLPFRGQNSTTHAASLRISQVCRQQCCGSGSTGSTCFWASRIRI